MGFLCRDAGPRGGPHHLADYGPLFQKDRGAILPWGHFRTQIADRNVPSLRPRQTATGDLAMLLNLANP